MPSWTEITKPSQGDTTAKSFADAVVDDLNYLFSQISGLLGLAVPNASFEQDTDADSIPDQWTRTLYTGGALAITGVGLADTVCNHGRRAIKFTSPGGASNGGGYIDNTDFLECSPGRAVIVSVQHYSTVATIRNKVEVLFYDASQVYISTATIYTSITNPTSWQTILGGVSAPSTARYMKLRLTGAEDTTTVAGSAYFDDVRIGLAQWLYDEKIEAGGTYASHRWTCPTGVAIAEFTLIGAGGGSGGADTGGGNLGGGGGGGGGFVRAILPVVAGTSYVFSVGTGGAGGGANADGVAGGNTTITIGAVVLTASGGARGRSGSSGGSGGAGGTATGGTINTSGVNGSNRSGTSGGSGGYSPSVGLQAIGDAGNAAAGMGAGGGGAGGGTAQAGADGADGRLIIRF